MKIDRAIWLLIGAALCVLLVAGLFSLLVGNSTYTWIFFLLASGLVVWIIFG